MKIVVTGGTGFIGEPLVAQLQKRGDVAVFSRDPSKVRIGRGVQWDPPGGDNAWRREVSDADVVINLAGENIGAGRWTESRKQRLVKSRLDATEAIVSALRERSRAGCLLVNASAVGYYGSRGEEVLDEDSSSGDDFLAHLCKRWEAASLAAEPAVRVVIFRFGVVIGRDGGALKKMVLPFRFFAGGPLGSGRQWMSWVDRADVIRAVEWAADLKTARGVFNLTSPNPVRNDEFAKTLGAVLHRPAFLPAPAPALRVALGEMADMMLLASQRVVPRRLENEGFQFEFPSIRDSLEQAVKKPQF